MNRCPDCLFAVAHPDTRWHCHHPVVNRERPSFLAGNPQSAQSCFAERQNFVGRCGRKGELFEPRTPSMPAEPDA